MYIGTEALDGSNYDLESFFRPQCPSIHQPHILPFPAHPLDIERSARAERLAINEEEEPRAFAVREIMRRLA
jgi:hypothetical protein